MLVTAVIWQPDRVRLLTNINHLKRPELRWTASNTDEDCLALARDDTGGGIMQWLSKIFCKDNFINLVIDEQNHRLRRKVMSMRKNINIFKQKHYMTKIYSSENVFVLIKD